MNPSGKLNETYPIQYEHAPVHLYYPARQRTAEYREGLYVGYRYFSTAEKPVLYPFGHGLSYTTFAYSGLCVEPGKVSFALKNTGDMAGAEVAQLYVGCRDGKVFRPAMELKGFEKVFLQAGESKTVCIPLDDKAFRYFNISTKCWETETAEYQVFIGTSVADIQLAGVIAITGSAANPYAGLSLPSYYSAEVERVDDVEFTVLLGRKTPDGVFDGELGPNDPLCQMACAKSRLARLVCRYLESTIKKAEAKGKPDLNALFQYNMPFRAIAKMTNGMVSQEMVDGMLLLVNGHFLTGMGQIAGGFFRNRKRNKKDLAILKNAGEMK